MAKQKKSRYPGLYKPPNSTIWHYRFMLSGKRQSTSTGEREVVKAWEIACKLREQAKREAADPHARHADTPLEEHVSAWENSLHAAGNTPRYVKLVGGRARKVISNGGFKTWSDINADAVKAFIAQLREQDAAHTINRTNSTHNTDRSSIRSTGTRTRNYHVQAIKQFTRWLHDTERAPHDSLRNLKREKGVKADLRHARRPFSVEEWRYLVAFVEQAPPNFGVSGPDRSHLYRFAGETGLRSNEIRTLVWNALDLDGKPPSVTVRAAYAKNGEPRSVPLRPDLCEQLKQWRASRQDETPLTQVFRMPNPTNVARMLKADLASARTQWLKDAPTAAAQAEREATSFLAYCDHENRYADFHSFRHLFASLLARSGVAVKTAQELLGHKTIAQTLEIYAHVVLADQAEAIKTALPTFTHEPAQSSIRSDHSTRSSTA